MNKMQQDPKVIRFTVFLVYVPCQIWINIFSFSFTFFLHQTLFKRDVDKALLNFNLWFIASCKSNVGSPLDCRDSNWIALDCSRVQSCSQKEGTIIRNKPSYHISYVQCGHTRPTSRTHFRFQVQKSVGIISCKLNKVSRLQQGAFHTFLV